jgi:signal transduction histidine kinase
MFAGCFVISGVSVMATSGYHSLALLERQMKNVVANESNEALMEAHSHDVPHLRPIMTELVQNEPGFYYLLENARQEIIVGNMFHLQPVAGWRRLPWTHRSVPPDHRLVIGYGSILQDGGYLFVGIDGEPLQTLRHDLWFILSWSVAGFIVIGTIGGFILSRLVLGRIENISQTARNIMRGDISQRITLNATNDEFDHLAVSLNAMLDRNEHLIDSVRQVTDDIAHDMRRPLSRLAQQLDEIARDGLTEPQVNVLNRARGSLEEALEIFSSLLKLAQIEADEDIPDSQLLNVDDLLVSVAELYQPIIESKRQKLELNCLCQTARLSGNKALLMQVLVNLLENAINHCPPGSRILLSSFTEGETITITVADNGPGIPSHERERVFEKMVRLDNSRSVPGSGLGLSMVQAIVRLHKGQIKLLDNDPGLRCEIRLRKAPVATS